jgi:L-asparagine transporter-like permease
MMYETTETAEERVEREQQAELQKRSMRTVTWTWLGALALCTLVVVALLTIDPENTWYTIISGAAAIAFIMIAVRPHGR